MAGSIIPSFSIGSGVDARRERICCTFRAFLANVAQGALLRVLCGDERYPASGPYAEPPRVAGFEARSEGDGLSLAWRTELDADAEPEGWLQWSPDGGRVWLALQQVPQNESAAGWILPAGVFLLRLLVDDGFYTTASEPVAVERLA